MKVSVVINVSNEELSIRVVCDTTLTMMLAMQISYTAISSSSW
jgi:hypothetical protein